jgi:hypothetical protein
MWHALAGLCAAQLWALLGLLPALSGGPVAWTWAGLAALTGGAGLAALRRHPDAGLLLLGLVLPITLIPPFVLGRHTAPLLSLPAVQGLAGALVALELVALALARRSALAVPGDGATRPVDAGRRRRPGARPESVRVALLLLCAVWVALPVRALLDGALLDGALADRDPVRAKEVLLVVAWLSASALVPLCVVPAAAAGSDRGAATRASRAAVPVGGLVLLAAWTALVLAGA